MTLLVIFSQYGQAQRPLNSEVDKELRALLIARRDVLKDLDAMVSVRRMATDMHIGPGDIGRISQIRQELYRAELELADSKEDRIEILTKALEKQAEAEDFAEARGNDGRDEVFSLKADRIRIEIELHKEKKKP